MPKNKVSDLITDQEMAYAHLIMSGTMTDRAAAEAVGLNPDTAAYTKAKPRVRAYMNEHRAAVREKLVNQEAELSRLAVEGQRQLSFGRDQVLNRLWELATLSSEATRGSIAGQIKALSMIAAIEGLIPDRRRSPSGMQPAAPPVKPQIYPAEWLRKQKQAAGEEPGDPVDAAEAQPDAPHVAHPGPAPEPAPKPANGTSSPNLDPPQPTLANPFIDPESQNWVPLATGAIFDAIGPNQLLRPPFSPNIGLSARRRGSQKKPNFIEFYKISRPL